MSKDHYVARTYLKHFVGNNGMLHGYSKSKEKDFPCWPDDICHEWDGDIINDFLPDPEMLGRYRKIFEPAWNIALENLFTGQVTPNDKIAISGYWANLMVCTPAMRRTGVKSHDYSTLHHLRADDALRTRNGKPDMKLKRMLAAFNSGEYRIETKPDAIRAIYARKLMNFAWALYNSDWIIIKNDTNMEFLTSDNPVAFDDPGPWRGGRPRLPRYLPITPRICLYCDMTSAERVKDEPPDFSKKPHGRIRSGMVPMHGVERINRAVVQCAEDLVISSSKRDEVADLVKAHAKHRVDVDFIEIEYPDSFILGIHTRVRELPSVSIDEVPA